MTTRAENASRRKTAPAGPTAGNSLVARAAPVCTLATAATTSTGAGRTSRRRTARTLPADGGCPRDAGRSRASTTSAGRTAEPPRRQHPAGMTHDNAAVRGDAVPYGRSSPRSAPRRAARGCTARVLPRRVGPDHPQGRPRGGNPACRRAVRAPPARTGRGDRGADGRSRLGAARRPCPPNRPAAVPGVAAAAHRHALRRWPTCWSWVPSAVGRPLAGGGSASPRVARDLRASESHAAGLAASRSSCGCTCWWMASASNRARERSGYGRSARSRDGAGQDGLHRPRKRATRTSRTPVRPSGQRPADAVAHQPSSCRSVIVEVETENRVAARHIVAQHDDEGGVVGSGS